MTITEGGALLRISFKYFTFHLKKVHGIIGNNSTTPLGLPQFCLLTQTRFKDTIRSICINLNMMVHILLVTTGRIKGHSPQLETCNVNVKSICLKSWKQNRNWNNEFITKTLLNLENLCNPSSGLLNWMFFKMIVMLAKEWVSCLSN